MSFRRNPSRPSLSKQMPYNDRMKTSIRNLLSGALIALLWPLLARADFPDHTVKIVVPFPPGGTIDAVARALGQRLNEK